MRLFLLAIRARSILQGLDQNGYGSLVEIAGIPQLIQIVGELCGDSLEVEGFEMSFLGLVGWFRLLRNLISDFGLSVADGLEEKSRLKLGARKDWVLQALEQLRRLDLSQQTRLLCIYPVGRER